MRDTERQGAGLIADNLVGFARVLRAAGLPIGPGAIVDALTAIQWIDIGNRNDLFVTLESIFVKRREHRPIFAQVFATFIGRAVPAAESMVDPQSPLAQAPSSSPPAAARRVEEAFSPPREPDATDTAQKTVELSMSDREILQRKDFAQMSAAEITDAIRAIAQMKLPNMDVRTRRFAPDPRGRRFDLRRTLRGSLRSGGAIVNFHRLGATERPAPIVALLDISGSMSEYTRLFLHFLHAVSDARKRVSVFLFGTRLTNVTRALRFRDPDEALAACSASVEDWSGGTRIATSLHAFNKLWGRRVLGQGAIVLLITDGLEREVDRRLEFEMDRLHRSARRLIWLNPLLRFEGFEARAQGIKMMLPHVDEFRTLHNLESIADILAGLASPAKAQSHLPPVSVMPRPAA